MVEKVQFKVLRRIDDLDIRQYPSITLATVEGYPDNSAFRILFDYNHIPAKAEQFQHHPVAYLS